MNLALPESIKVSSQFIHPIVMLTLLGTAIYALYLGLKVRQTRTAEKETRKDLVKGRYDIKHYQVGSVLLAFITIGAIFAMAVTYINNNKLILGPHLIVGLTTVCLIAVSASLAPLMQKGNNLARNIHLALNIGVLGLFSWQAITGLQILLQIVSEL